MKQHCLHGDGFPHLLIRSYLSLATFVFYFQTLLGKYILVPDYKKYFWLLEHIGKWTWFETRAKDLECWLVIYSSAPCHVKRLYKTKKVIFFNPGNFLQLKSTKFLICESICTTYKVCFIRYQMTWHKGFIIL